MSVNFNAHSADLETGVLPSAKNSNIAALPPAINPSSPNWVRTEAADYRAQLHWILQCGHSTTRNWTERFWGVIFKTTFRELTKPYSEELQTLPCISWIDCPSPQSFITVTRHTGKPRSEEKFYEMRRKHFMNCHGNSSGASACWSCYGNGRALHTREVHGECYIHKATPCPNNLAGPYAAGSWLVHGRITISRVKQSVWDRSRASVLQVTFFLVCSGGRLLERFFCKQDLVMERLLPRNSTSHPKSLNLLRSLDSSRTCGSVKPGVLDRGLVTP